MGLIYQPHFLMRSANKIILVQTADGTNLGTRTAARTFFVIDYRKIIYNGNSVVRTGLYTLSASDTTVLTCLSRNSTPFVI